MSDSVLNKLVGNDTKNQKEQAKQTQLLADILGVQKDILKVEENRTKQESRERQRARRGGADKPTTLKKMFEKDSKDKKGGILAMLGKAISGVVAGIGSLGLLKALGITALGGVITAMFKSKEFRDMIFGAFGGMKDAIGNFLFGNDGVFNAKQRKEIAGNLKEKLGNFVKRFTDPIVKFLDEFELKMLKLNNRVKGGFNKFLTGRDTDDARIGTKSKVDQIEGKLAAAKLREDKEKIKSLEKELADAKAKDLLVQQADSMRNQKKALERRLGTKGRGAVKGEQRAELQKKLENLATNIKIKEGQMSKAGILGYQNGGFVGTVPFMGGNGDRFPAMLSSGSVVLNQTAAGMMQNGGMVPTLLEQGEKVYSPRDPGAGAALMMNSMVPRFQEGGQVPTGTKDSKDIKKSEGSDLIGKGAQFASGPITPGGKMTFIGDGSGFTGEIKLIDGSGKTVAKIGGVSGTSRTANASQTDRANISGTLNPLPDGTFPLETQTKRHPGGKVGNWSSWINNSEGQIGNRGQLYVHNDLKSNGTAGCIGVEAGGARGSKDSMKFADVYDAVAPQSVKVNLTSSDGGSYSPELSKGNNGFSASDVTSGLGPLLKVFAEFGAVFSGMKLGDGFGLGGSSGSDGPMPNVSGSGMEKAKKIKKALIEKGYSSAAAAGIVGNLYHESDAFKADTEYGGGGGRGWAQWTGVRRNEFEAYSKAQGLSPSSDEANMKYLLHELNEGRHWSGGGSTSELKNIQDPGQAARYFMDKWERPGTPHWDRRLSATNQIAQLRTGGVANMRGGGTAQTTSMVRKSQEAFAEQIAAATTPVIIPVPSGGGGGGRDSGAGASTTFPVLASEDSSIVSMEYKYRITMGASV